MVYYQYYNYWKHIWIWFLQSFKVSSQIWLRGGSNVWNMIPLWAHPFKSCFSHEIERESIFSFVYVKNLSSPSRIQTPGYYQHLVSQNSFWFRLHAKVKDLFIFICFLLHNFLPVPIVSIVGILNWHSPIAGVARGHRHLMFTGQHSTFMV